jgi:hypothetical protein
MGYSLEGLSLMRPSLEHQRAARNIVVNYSRRNGFRDFEAFQDGMVDSSDSDGLVSDVVFLDSYGKSVVVVEIEETRHLKYRALPKVPTLIEEYGVKEVFIFDYQKGNWVKFMGNKELYDVSHSSVLQIDFKEYTSLP